LTVKSILRRILYRESQRGMFARNAIVDHTRRSSPSIYYEVTSWTITWRKRNQLHRRRMN